MRSHPEPEARGGSWKEPPTPEARAGGQEEQPEEWWLRSTGGPRGAILVQGKEQLLCFAGAEVKRYPTPKVRETQVRW